MITPALLVLARPFWRLPASASQGFAGLLNTATGVFNEVNFRESGAGTRFLDRQRMVTTLDRLHYPTRHFNIRGGSPSGG
jgi:hypothetical protein